MFLRDSGGDGPPVLLLHGWMFSADLNWYMTYAPLDEAGYRVLAVDHRGHGRGHPHRRAVHAQGLRRRRRRAARPPQDPAGARGRLLDGRPDRLDPRPRPSASSSPGSSSAPRRWTGAAAHEGRSGARWRRCGSRSASRPSRLWQRGLQGRRLPATRRSRPGSPAELSRGNSVDIAEAGRELGRYDATHLDRRPRRPARGHRHHPGHRRPAVQAARARRGDERARCSRSTATTAP